MGKSMKKRLQRNSGFISTYFLGILLYVTSVITVITFVDQQMIETYINMKQANQYLKEEIEILSDLKYRILSEETGEVELNSCTYSFEIEEQFIYVNVISEYPESIIVTIDPEEKIVLSYTCDRDDVD